MRALEMIGCLAAALFVGQTGVAWGQLVRVYADGGVSIRVPFVRVEVDSAGGTYVRAPFTSVYAPGRYYYDGFYGGPAGYGVGPAYPDYGEPSLYAFSEENLAQMDWQELRRAGRAAAAQLELALDQVEHGTAWKRFLRPGDLQDLLAEDGDRPPAPETRQRLMGLLQAYDSVSGDPTYDRISSLPPFIASQHILAALTTEVVPRQRRLLAESARQLQQTLWSWQYGADWSEYLQLPAEVFRADSDQPLDVQRLEQALAQYGRIADREDYARLATLPSFQATHERLGDLVQLLHERPLGPLREQRPIEELPAPTRDVELNAPELD